MSVPSMDQGCTGISCPSHVDGMGLHLDCEYLRHSAQFKINFSSWSFKPGQYTIFDSELTFTKLKCSLIFLVWYHHLGSLQDNIIFDSQLFFEGPIRLYLAWHFSDGTWPSMCNSMLEQHKPIIFFGSNCHLIQVVTSDT